MKNRRFAPYLVLAGFISALITTNLAFEDPVPVHADFGNFIGAVDYVAALEGAEAEAFYSTPGGPVVAGIILGTRIALNHPIVTGTNVLASDFSVASGKYYSDASTVKIGCMASYNQDFSSVGDSRVMIAYSDDFEIYYSPLPSSGASITGLGTSLSSSGSQILYTALCNYSTNGGLTLGNDLANASILPGSYSVTNNNMQSAFFQFNCSGSIPYLYNSSIQNIASGSYYGRNRGSFIGSGTFTTLPGDSSTYIDEDYPDYIYNYIEINYPDFMYIFPEPEPSTEYATDDIIPGIPKDWTIINPELPTAPHFELDIPDADFSILDVSDTLGQYVVPIGFWFTLLDQILDTLHLKVIIYVALAFGVLIYIIWRLGR